MSQSVAMNTFPTQGPTVPSVHEGPAVQLQEEVDNDIFHPFKMAIAIAHAPITRPYLSFEETDDEFAYEEEDDDDYDSDSSEVVESGSEDESYYYDEQEQSFYHHYKKYGVRWTILVTYNIDC